jgi:hypothetical protein
MPDKNQDIENDTELHDVLWSCLSCLSDTKWRFIPQKNSGVTELKWVRDGVVHILEFIEKRYGLTKEDTERFAQMSWDRFERENPEEEEK